MAVPRLSRLLFVYQMVVFFGINIPSQAQFCKVAAFVAGIYDILRLRFFNNSILTGFIGATFQPQGGLFEFVRHKWEYDYEYEVKPVRRSTGQLGAARPNYRNCILTCRHQNVVSSLLGVRATGAGKASDFSQCAHL